MLLIGLAIKYAAALNDKRNKKGAKR